MDELELVTIGQITRNQGNRGEVRVIPLTDYPERFEVLERVFLDYSDSRDSEVLQPKEIESIRFHKQFVIIKFSGVDNIGQALELRDYYLKIPRDEAIPLEEDEFFIDDLTDLEVITAAGRKLGRIKEVITTGGVDVLVVAGGKKEYMIPAAREIIKRIDLHSGEVIIEPIPGLLDL